MDDLKGGVAGGSILTGVLKVCVLIFKMCKVEEFCDCVVMVTFHGQYKCHFLLLFSFA